jgi:hypothetical protein
MQKLTFKFRDLNLKKFESSQNNNSQKETSEEKIVKEHDKENDDCTIKEWRENYMVTRHKSSQKNAKVSDLHMTPDTAGYKDANTPDTCASSSPGSVESVDNKQKSLTENKSDKLTTNEQEFKQPKTCFKNLFDAVPEVEVEVVNYSKSKSESVSSNITEYLTMDEFYFDFEYAPVPTVSNTDLKFKKLISLNYIQSRSNDSYFNSSEFENFDFMGDRILPISYQY